MTPRRSPLKRDPLVNEPALYFHYDSEVGELGARSMKQADSPINFRNGSGSFVGPATLV
jgi:hypothetical protein